MALEKSEIKIVSDLGKMDLELAALLARTLSQRKDMEVVIRVIRVIRAIRVMAATLSLLLQRHRALLSCIEVQSKNPDICILVTIMI